jgi:hypothetical protein
MDLIAKQLYVKIIREVDGLMQKDVEEQRCLYLYTDRIVTIHREFPLGEVLDISYKEIAGRGGLLYLHTLSGVFPYIVKEDPHAFIRSFKAAK